MPDRPTIRRQCGRSPRRQPADTGRLSTKVQSHSRGNAIGDAFDVEEIHRTCPATPMIPTRSAGPHGCYRTALATAASEPRADLEQSHVALFAVTVVGDRADQTGQYRRSQHAE